MDETIAALTALGWPVWDTDATGADLTKPYLILQSSDGRPASETVLSGGDNEDSLIVKHVATQRAAVVIMFRRTRAVLAGKRFATADGRVIDAHFDGTSDIYPDMDVVIPGSGRHPVIGLDEYTLFVQ